MLSVAQPMSFALAPSFKLEQQEKIIVSSDDHVDVPSVTSPDMSVSSSVGLVKCEQPPTPPMNESVSPQQLSISMSDSYPQGQSDVDIFAQAKFYSFADFERAFESWKQRFHHPFRVASSETLKQPDGSTNELFKYRYIVFHCAHYGAPRMRGAGKRPNQNYLPCGCHAMLRLNYNYQPDNALRVTTLKTEHSGHEVSEDAFMRFSAKLRRLSPGTVSMSPGAQSNTSSTGSPAPPAPAPARKRRSLKSVNGNQPIHQPTAKRPCLSPTSPNSFESHKENNFKPSVTPAAFQPFGQQNQNMNPINNNMMMNHNNNNNSTGNSSTLMPALLRSPLMASALFSQNPQLFAAALQQQQQSSPFSSPFTSPMCSPLALPPQTGPMDLSAAKPNVLEGSGPQTVQTQIGLLMEQMQHSLNTCTQQQLFVRITQLNMLLKSWNP